jgi:hypothetical protein
MTRDQDLTSLRGVGRAAGWRRPVTSRWLVPWLRVVVGALAVLFATKAAQVRAASEGDKPPAT